MLPSTTENLLVRVINLLDGVVWWSGAVTGGLIVGFALLTLNALAVNARDNRR